MRIRRPAFLLLGAALAALILIGCGGMPTGPAPTAFSSSSGSNAQPAGLLTGLVDGVVGLLVRTLSLIGSLGGSLTNGRWTVAIPAGAVDGSATVSLGVASSTSASCQLGISPADKNHFDVPVTLTVDCRSVPSDQLANYTIYWFDPSQGKWVEVASNVDLTNKRVSATLAHFSQYAVGEKGGKAGW
jgi:hypothetical protein